MINFLDEFVNYKDTLNFKNKIVTFFGSARLDESSIYYKKAYELAFTLSENGFAIVTGGGDGIMRAANKGAYKSGKSHSIAFNIRLPFEQSTNPFITNSFLFSSFSPRKFALIDNSVAFVVFPGGFGTLDELFEILTLAQTGIKSFKIFLYGEKFWAKLDEFIKTTLLDNKTIDTQSLKLYKITDDLNLIADEILNI